MTHNPTATLAGRLAAALAGLLMAAAAVGAPAPAEQLELAARQWAAELSGQPMSQLVMRPLDARVTVKDCGQWRFDMPFGPGQAIRARCEKPRQQLFLSLEERPEALDQLAQASGAATHAGGAASRSDVAPHLAGLTRKPVLVATHNLPAHTPLQPEHFELREVALHGPEKDYFTSPAGLEFAQSLKPIKAGDPLRGRDVRPAILIKRGQVATLSVSRVPGLAIAVRVEALQDGRYGEQIRFKNTESGRTTLGEVVGKGQAVAL